MPLLLSHRTGRFPLQRICPASESFQGVGAADCFVRQRLQSHKVAKLDILRCMDYVHASAAEFFDHAVVRNCNKRYSCPENLWFRMCEIAFESQHDEGSSDIN
jgi:hypothetical protein